MTPNMLERLMEHRINTAPSAQPIIRIITDNVNIIPLIHLDQTTNHYELQEEKRYNILVPVEIINIGNIPAQNIILDAEVKFKKRRPLGVDVLPSHRYDFIDFLSPESSNKKRSLRKSSVSFDGFVAKEVIRDFLKVGWNGLGSLISLLPRNFPTLHYGHHL